MKCREKNIFTFRHNAHHWAESARWEKFKEFHSNG